MRAWMVILIVMVSIAAAGAVVAAGGGDLRAAFEKGNEAYESGDYEGAVEHYREAVALGARDADLYYNLGNAYYKEGQLGWAVLSYERALTIRPRDADVLANLSLVRSLLGDKQFIENPGIAKRAATWLHRNLSVGETFSILSALYLLLMIAMIGYIIRDTRFVSRVYPKLSLVSPGRFLGLNKREDFILAIVSLFVLFSATGVSAIGKYREVTHRRAAVVVVEEVPVYSGPRDDSTLQFKIHEGTRVRAVETRPGWVRIALPGDLSGWVASSSIERI
jgi:hypothetical protein